MARNSFAALCIYFIIYAIAQGIMDAYEEAIEQPYLEHNEVNLELVGLAQTIDFLPWCFKFVWAIPSDSYNFLGFGHRRPYVVIGILMAAIAFGSMTLFNPGHYLWLYMICMSLRNIGVAVADCAVDGLSVDCQMDTEAGAIQGWMSLGRTAGTVLAAVSAGFIAKDYGYELAILVSAGFMFIPLPANWFILEEWVDEKAYEDKMEDAAAVAVAAKTLDKAAHGGKGGSGMTMAEAAAAVRKEFEEEEKRRALGLAPGAPLPGSGTSSGLASGGCHGGSTIGRTGVPMPGGLGSNGSGNGSDEDPNNPARRYSEGASSSDEKHSLMSAEESTERAKKSLKRRQSFVAKVAVSVGFDWDMLQELLAKRHVYMFLVYLLLSTMGVALTNFSLTAWVHTERGFGIDEVGIVMSVMSIGCFIASLPMGYMFDYIPSKRSTMFFAALVTGLANLLLIWCHTKVEVYLGLFGFGAAHGVIYVVQCSMARILADMRIAAAFFGIVNSTGNIAHALGTALGGPIAERINLEANFIIGAAIDFIALAFCLLLPEAELRLSREDAAEGKMKVLKHRMREVKTASAVRKTALNTTAEALKDMDDMTKARLMALSGTGRLPGAGLGTGGPGTVRVGAYTVALRPHSAGPTAHSHLPDKLGVIAPANLDDVIRRNPVHLTSVVAEKRAKPLNVASPHAGLTRRPSFKEKVEAYLEEVNEEPSLARAAATGKERSLMSAIFGLPPNSGAASKRVKYRRNSAAAGAQSARISGLPLAEVLGMPTTPVRGQAGAAAYASGAAAAAAHSDGSHVLHMDGSGPGSGDRVSVETTSGDETASTDDPTGALYFGGEGVGAAAGSAAHAQQQQLNREARYNPFSGPSTGGAVSTSAAMASGLHVPGTTPAKPRPLQPVVDYAPATTAAAMGGLGSPPYGQGAGAGAGAGGLVPMPLYMPAPPRPGAAAAQAQPAPAASLLGLGFSRHVLGGAAGPGYQDNSGLDSLADGVVDDVTGAAVAHNPLAMARAQPQHGMAPGVAFWHVQISSQGQGQAFVQPQPQPSPGPGHVSASSFNGSSSSASTSGRPAGSVDASDRRSRMAALAQGQGQGPLSPGR